MPLHPNRSKWGSGETWRNTCAAAVRDIGWLLVVLAWRAMAYLFHMPLLALGLEVQQATEGERSIVKTDSGPGFPFRVAVPFDLGCSFFPSKPTKLHFPLGTGQGKTGAHEQPS